MVDGNLSLVASGGGPYRKAFELRRESFCHGARRGSLSSRGGPHPPSKIGTRGPHYTREDRDGGPHSPGRMGTGVPILPGERGPGVPDKGDPQNFMTPGVRAKLMNINIILNLARAPSLKPPSSNPGSATGYGSQNVYQCMEAGMHGFIQEEGRYWEEMVFCIVNFNQRHQECGG